MGVVFLDAYAAGLTDNVQRFCWSRGYIEITHGGGASSVLQTNDTDHHLWVRKRFIELQHDTHGGGESSPPAAWSSSARRWSRRSVLGPQNLN